MAVEPTTRSDVEESTHSETGTGLDENLAGALAYLLGPLSGLLFFVIESENEFVRFHAAQSIVFGVGMFAVYMLMGIFQFALLLIPRIGGLFSLLFTLVYFVVGFFTFMAWLFLMYKAYSEEKYELPVFGNLAARIA
ncbi:DUF4870 domain-containing protein [Haladaptatus sp. NG-SE-30]